MTTAEPPVHLRDPATLRALAHPARLTIINYLADGRMATATQCAEVVGLSPSATSYHLRALAKVGLVREAPGRGDGRERVWTGAPRSYVVAEDQAVDPETRAAEDALVDALLSMHDARAREFLARRGAEDPQWWAAATFTSRTLELTAAELGELNEKIRTLTSPYRQGDRKELPEGARRVSISFFAIPLPGDFLQRTDVKD